MENFYKSCPRKVYANQLTSLSPPIPVWVNGKIEQTVGTDILIINDGTGRVKISNCGSAQSPDDRSWIKKGSHCRVVGLLMKTKGVPEILPNKLIDVTNEDINNESWKFEVEESNLFLEGKIIPHLGI